MSRIPSLEPPYAPDVRRSFDAIMKGREPLALFRTIAVSERAWARFRAGSLLDRGPLSLRAREIVIDRTTALADCEYEWGVHVAVYAKAAKLTGEQIAAIRNATAEAPCWSEAEQALIAAVDALHGRATLDRAEFDRLRTHYDDAQILEILMLCGFYRTVSYIANGLDLPLEPGAARFVEAEMPAAVERGQSWGERSRGGQS
jgi:alkylhydroperoxidase family enzyme